MTIVAIGRYSIINSTTNFCIEEFSKISFPQFSAIYDSFRNNAANVIVITLFIDITINELTVETLVKYDN